MKESEFSDSPREPFNDNDVIRSAESVIDTASLKILEEKEPRVSRFLRAVGDSAYKGCQVAGPIPLPFFVDPNRTS